MVVMAEGDSAVIFVSDASSTSNSHNGAATAAAIANLEATMTSDSDSESASTFAAARSYLSVAETKRRNKRKNFQPRNIAYSEAEGEEPYAKRDRRCSSGSSESDYALDLSNADADLLKSIEATGCKSKRRRLLEEDADADADQRPESSPMDLTCSKSVSPFAFGRLTSYYSDSDSDDVKSHRRRAVAGAGAGAASAERNLPEQRQRISFADDLQEQQQQRRRILNALKPSGGGYLSHPFLGQSGDASDLKEYAVNTFKELLEIYGLNSDATDVAQTITNNVPISNFSSGKILESLSASINDRGSTTLLFKNRNSPKSEPSSPPRSPNSVASFRTSNVTNSTTSPSKCKSELSFSKQMANRSQSIFSSTGAGLSQNMATILAMATMKEKLNSNNAACAEIKPSVTITPSSRLSPSLSSENGNSMNSTGVTIRRVSPASPPPSLKENRPQQMHQSLQQSASNHPIDYSRYVKRYSTAIECGNSYCKDLNYREHFHCLDCNSRVFVKKEEMIRHFKWHKKRDESLQHGFMRYSPSDDCSDRFQNCSHNRKQTHYHCIQGTCDKVYISTSDVQMHANYHRKDSAIIQEGFQRLRATEECRTSYCAFFGQRTTHFHCRREHCQFTFKNKADMEKHKTFHIKDEQLTRDGFKKFLKLDPCGYAGCKFSQVCNHIHCVRDGCSYVLHSTGQLSSHKRKHERKDTEMAYRSFKLNQQNVAGFNGTDQLSQFADRLLSPTTSLQLFQQTSLNSGVSTTYSSLHENSYSNSSSEGPVSPANSIKYRNNSNLPLAGGYFTENFSSMDFSHLEESSESWHRLISQYSASDVCPLGVKCPTHSTDHYHCKEPNCDSSFKTKEAAESHARMHEAQERLVESLYQEGTPYCLEESCPREKHYHCTWEGCYETILPHEKLDHLRTHEFSMSQFYSLDALFRRKRGRPPKNRIIEVWNDNNVVSGNDSPQAIFTSFKLPKPSGNMFANSSHQSDCEAGSPPHSRALSPKHIPQQVLEEYKFEEYVDACPDPLCTFSTSTSSSLHYHCRRPRCFYATNVEEQLQSHATDFHDKFEILDGFLYFDSSVDCRLDNCHNNKANRHFHCVRPGCGCSFVGYNVMIEHNNKHQLAENALKNNAVLENELENKITERSSPTHSASIAVSITATPPVATSLTASPETPNSKSTNVVKASGTFYPLCGLNNIRSTTPPPHNEDKQKCDSPAVQPETVPVIPPPSTPSTIIPSVISSAPVPLSITTSSTSPLPPLIPAALSISMTGVITSGTATPPVSKPASVVVAPPSALPSSPALALLPDWLQVDEHARFSTEKPCCRAFCKLKRKDHYHCNACNQAFSEIDKLKQHIVKHNTNSISPFVNKPENNNNNNSNTNNNISDDAEEMRHSPVIPTSSLPIGIESTYPAAGFMAAAQQLAMMTSQGISFLPHGMPALYTSPSGLMFATPQAFPHPHSLIGNNLLEAIPTHTASEITNDLSSRRSSSPQHEMSPELKKARIQTSMRILKDEPVPDGYLRFRFNEDCHYNHCGYREHQTHFHCVRQDCGYSFCDKTRFVQHTARHERLDTLMGGDFQQYRSNVSCGRHDCVHAASVASSQNKASHFHCLKCEFVCTDTNKVVAHRRQHQKSDSIMAAGFEKFTPSQACRQPDTCQHSGKQTHYHCLSCQYAVLGLSQMTAHKYRHMD